MSAAALNTEIELGITPETLAEIFNSDEAIQICKKRIEDHLEKEKVRRENLLKEIAADWQEAARLKKKVHEAKAKYNQAVRLVRLKEKKQAITRTEISRQERRIEQRKRVIKNKLMREVIQKSKKEFRQKFSGALTRAGLLK